MRWTVSQFRDELADREAIRHCLLRYARGVDRIDEDCRRPRKPRRGFHRDES